MNERVSFINKIVMLALICGGLLFVTGLNSSLYLGDEVIHYRFASNIFLEARRLAYDPLYDSGQSPGYFYIMEPLWHVLLALLWKFFGGISFVIAQAYQTFYYVALIFATFFLGRHIYDDKTGLASALVLATVPMIVSFSIIFYLDVPAAMYTTLFLLCFFKKKYWVAGLLIGLMYMTKRNACFIVPVIPVMLIFEYRKNIVRGFARCIQLLVPCALIISWDVIWRVRNIGSFFKQPVSAHPSIQEGMRELVFRKDFIEDFFTSGKFIPSGNQNSVLLSPRDIVTYFGVVLLFLLAAYFVFRKFNRKDLLLWVPVAGYLVTYFGFFTIASDIRYLIPIVPFLCILGAKVLIGIENGFFKKITVGICLFQLVSSCGYAYYRRQIPESEIEAFEFVKENIGREELLMYPEPILFASTEKRAVWGTYKMWPYLFWGMNDEKMATIEINDLNYIIVKHARVYDDSSVRHCGGYPRSFVEKMPEMNFLSLMYQNDAITIWKIDRKVTSAEKMMSKK